MGSLSNFLKFGSRDKVFEISKKRLLKYKVVDSLGNGSSGKVYKIMDKETRKEYALKVVPLDNRNPKAFKEVDCLRDLKTLDKHEHILEYNWAGVVKQWPIKKMQAECNLESSSNTTQPHPHLCIITELCETTLRKKLWEERGPEFFGEMWKLALQLACGLKHVHSKGIMHRDLTPSNILLNGNSAKIGDFGLSRYVPGMPQAEGRSLTTTRVGSYLYQSFEIGKEYTEKCDVFSLAIIYFEMFNLFVMINPSSTEVHPDMLILREAIADEKDLLQLLSEMIPEENMRNLIAVMISPEGRRPTSEQVYNRIKEVMCVL